MLRIYEIKLKVYEKEQALPSRILRALKNRDVEIGEYHVAKSSLDSRHKGHFKMVYTVDFSVKSRSGNVTEEELENQILSQGNLKFRVEKQLGVGYREVCKGTEMLLHRPVVAGFGPCGMFAALTLAERGYCPIILERGKPVNQRVEDVNRFWREGVFDPESNVQFGEGGAGTFSDGKLTTRIKDDRAEIVLKGLVEAGADLQILQQKRPHIGTDVLRSVVRKIRMRILEQGGEILFRSKVTGLEFADDGRGGKALRAVVVNGTDRIPTEALILAVGHSARDTFRMLKDAGLSMEQKAFSMGVRIEHPQKMIDLSQYGADAAGEKLPAATYQLNHHCGDGRGAYTFCMCPGGQVVAAASQEGAVVTNGMSGSKRDGINANSAVLVDVRPEDFGSDDVLAGVEFQQKYEEKAFVCGGSNYNAPAQRLGDFLAGRPTEGADSTLPVQPTYSPGVTYTNLADCLPDFVVRDLKEAFPEMGRRLRGFDSADALLTGPETRSSSPVRILRGDDHQANIRGIWPGGEGAGYAGGIISSAVDGIRLAEEIVKKYRPYQLDEDDD